MYIMSVKLANITTFCTLQYTTIPVVKRYHHKSLGANLTLSPNKCFKIGSFYKEKAYFYVILMLIAPNDRTYNRYVFTYRTQGRLLKKMIYCSGF